MTSRKGFLWSVPVSVLLGAASLWQVASEDWPPMAWLGSAVAFVLVFLAVKSVVRHWNRHVTPKERANIERAPGWLALGTAIGVTVAFALMPLLGENQLVLDFVFGFLWPFGLLFVPLGLVQAVRREGAFELEAERERSARQAP